MFISNLQDKAYLEDLKRIHAITCPSHNTFPHVPLNSGTAVDISRSAVHRFHKSSSVTVPKELLITCYVWSWCEAVWLPVCWFSFPSRNPWSFDFWFARAWSSNSSNSTSGSRPQSTAHLVIRIVRPFQCRSIIPRHVQSFLDLLIERHLQSHHSDTSLYHSLNWLL